MRRPTFCGGGVEGGASSADDECACLASTCPAPRSPAPDEGRLARVKRLLAGSLMARTRRPRAFGVPVAEQPGGGDGVPDVLVRLCGYIEEHGLQCGGLFRLSAGKPRLVERLRAQIERSGDADLEGVSDVHSAAQLLKLWLRELPEPVITLPVAERLLAVHHKFVESPLSEWRVAVADTLDSLPAEHRRLLAFLARFLLRCTLAASRQCRHADNIAAVFAPLLLREAVAGARCVPAVQLMERLLADAHHLFPLEDTERMDVEPAIVLAEPDTCAGNLRKRKEHNEICGGRDLRKVVRSNSEERALSACGRDDSSIRRVSSHEDFSLVKNNNNNNHNNNNNINNNSFLSQLIEPGSEHGVLSLRPGTNACSEEEHERRRRSERECRAAAQLGRRPAPRRRRAQRMVQPSQPAEPSRGQQSPLSPVSSSTSEEDGNTQAQEGVVSSHAGTPLRELLHANEALPSQALLSPRGCVPLGGGRGGLDPSVPPSPPQEHSPRSPRSPRSPAQLDTQMKHLHKQTSSVKRKLKRFDERFEREHGYRPSHADKMADREVKHLGAELLRLRKEMKQLKDESPTDSDSLRGPAAMEAALREVEQHLESERQTHGRPWALTALTPAQTLEEKASVQRALLYLESVGGRPAARAQRDLVRPLYDRYRALKRALLRNGTAASKDSVSELATILEHETMNFSSQPPAALAAPDEQPAPEPVQEPVTQEPGEEELVSDDPDNRLDLENLHSLPLWRLLEQTRAVREEKRQLRRELREFEADFARRAGRKLQREDRAPHEARYAAYKSAKARLRLLQVLASKHTATV